MTVKKDKTTGKWYVRVSYKNAEGKYKTKNKFGFLTKKEAEVYESKLELMKYEGKDLEADKDMEIFANYFEEWVNTYKIGKVSISTEKKYLRVVNLVKEYFKDLPLKKLTRQKYQKFINKRGEGTGYDTVSKTNFYIKKCLKTAMADGLIDKDPTFEVILNYDNKNSSRATSWNYDEAKKLNDRLSNSDDFKDLMLYISLNTGARIGEVYGLAYSDFRGNKMSINRGYDYIHLNDFTDGKTKSSIRTILVTDELINKVNKHKLKHRIINRDFLFLDKNNKPLITHTGLLKHLKKLTKELEISNYTIHTLRHTHCSVLIYEGVNINYISKRLGHSSAVETIRRYSHIIDELEQTQNEKIDNILNKMTAK